MFNEFSTANIQIDKDFSAKLSGYGCIGHIQESDMSYSSVVSSYSDLCSDFLGLFRLFLGQQNFY